MALTSVSLGGKYRDSHLDMYAFASSAVFGRRRGSLTGDST